MLKERGYWIHGLEADGRAGFDGIEMGAFTYPALTTVGAIIDGSRRPGGWVK